MMNKVRVMIVDDEKITREGIVNGIDWSRYNIEVVDKAENGLEAYLLAQEMNPDIIVTDVRMPVMDGLQLAENLKRDMPRIRVIIISGYQEFEYAKQAISYGVEDYLLKPLNEEEFIGRILGVAQKIEDDRKTALKKNLDYFMLKKDTPFMYRYQKLEKNLVENFKQMNIREVEKAIEDIYRFFVEMENSEYYNEVCIRQFVYFREIMKNWGLNDEVFDIDFMVDNELCKCKNAEEIKKWQIEKVKEFINIAGIHKGSKYKKVVGEVENFIEENYFKDITLKDASSRVFISPQYLSKIFRSEKGIPFVEWINLYRIEKAKTILDSEDEKITNVACRVGFGNYRYFSSVFKKYTGVTPRDYKKNIRGA